MTLETALLICGNIGLPVAFCALTSLSREIAELKFRLHTKSSFSASADAEKPPDTPQSIQKSLDSRLQKRRRLIWELIMIHMPVLCVSTALASKLTHVASIHPILLPAGALLVVGIIVRLVEAVGSGWNDRSIYRVDKPDVSRPAYLDR